MSKNGTKRITIFALLSLCAFALWAQPKYNSPYSRIGLGDLVQQNFVRAAGMGQLGIGTHHYGSLNILNPASYGHLQTTAYEIGVFAQRSNLQSNGMEEIIYSGNLGYMALAFPVLNPLNDVVDREQSNVGWGMTFALVPYSVVGYNTEVTQDIETANNVNFSFRGTGGTYRFMFGNGVKVKNFSAGINLAYLFGKLNDDRRITFPEVPSSFEEILHEDIHINGFTWDAGLQYDWNFKDKDGKVTHQLTVGLTGSSATNINTRETLLNIRILQPAFRDTIDFVSEVEGNGKLPGQFGVGVSGGKLENWMVGAEFRSAAWSNYENDAKPQQLSDTWQFSAGAEIIPDFDSYNSYFKRMRYRFGLVAASDPRSDANGEQLNRFAATIGFGFPIERRNQPSAMLNVALEAGRFGSDDAIKENYARLSVGFTLNDNFWFFKRKFN